MYAFDDIVWLHLNKPYLLLFDSPTAPFCGPWSWWELRGPTDAIELPKSQVHPMLGTSSTLNAGDFFDIFLWRSLWKISTIVSNKLIQIVILLSETEILWDFFFWFLDVDRDIYIYIQWVSNCHFTVHVLYYFNFGGRDDYSCLVVELIQFWSNDSEDHKPSEPRINHNPQQGNPVASAGSSFLKDVLLPCSDWKSWMGRPLKDPS